MAIHPTAVIEPGATLGEGVEIGAYAFVGRGAFVGPGSRLHPHAMVIGRTFLGPRNEVHPFAVLGGDPQDKSYQGEETTLVVGEGNVFREHVTVNRGTAKDRKETRIGSFGLFMAGAHVAHDGLLGDRVILANQTLLAGHVTLGDGVVTGGGVMVAPFCRIGRLGFLAGGARVERDVPPFCIAQGDRARVRALNHVGLSRAEVPPEDVAVLDKAFSLVFRSGEPLAVALPQLGDLALHPLVRELSDALCETATRRRT